jgi:hypothetical protein
MINRFAYEEAERLLDAYAMTRQASGKKGAKPFFRAYRKFKAILAVYAYIDFPSEDPKQRIAWAWEDAENAARGYGENILTGAFLQLWDHTTDTKEADRFHDVLTRAFMAAHEATATDVKRRYLSFTRKEPIRKGTSAFNLPIELPAWGPTLREWAEDEGFDALELEEQFTYLEETSRDLPLEEAEPEVKQKKPTLKLMPGGKS